MQNFAENEKTKNEMLVSFFGIPIFRLKIKRTPYAISRTYYLFGFLPLAETERILEEAKITEHDFMTDRYGC